MSERRGMVIVNTGDGKGKSSSAFGVMLRAVARGWNVIVVQFIKSDKWQTGEKKMAEELGVTWITGGDGFTWESEDMEATERAAQDAWARAAEHIASGEYDLVILDEATYPVTFGWIDVAQVVATIDGRPDNVNVVVTGRDADAQLIELADTVTEMVKIKHAFDAGITARRGLDFKARRPVPGTRYRCYAAMRASNARPTQKATKPPMKPRPRFSVPDQIGFVLVWTVFTTPTANRATPVRIAATRRPVPVSSQMAKGTTDGRAPPRNRSPDIAAAA